MVKANQAIRSTAKTAGICLWQIAEVLGVTDATFSRQLRREFTENKRNQVLQIIDSLKGEQEKEMNANAANTDN